MTIFTYQLSEGMAFCGRVKHLRRLSSLLASKYDPITSRHSAVSLFQSGHAQFRHNSSGDEVSKAHSAAAVGTTQETTIFAKIISKEIPASMVHEDEKCVAFRDVSPVSPTHILVIPRKPITMLSQAEDADTELLGHLLQVARKVADAEKLKEGYRIVINNGKHGAQSVYHLHIHVMGGRQFQWPPG